jgi:hypothetical protein
MRWIERLWRDDQRIKATPTRIAASVAEGVTRSTNVLRIRLQEEGFRPADHKRFESEACIRECLLFEWFLRDIVVTVEFGRHTDTVRQAVTRRLANDLDRTGLSPAVLLDFARLRGERFDEYRSATGVSISLQSLGTLAWRVLLPLLRRVHPLYAARVIERSAAAFNSTLLCGDFSRLGVRRPMKSVELLNRSFWVL